jgi:hypothetical protein
VNYTNNYKNVYLSKNYNLMAAVASGRTTALTRTLARALATLELEKTTDGRVGMAGNRLSNTVHPTETRTDNVTSGIGDGPNGTIGGTD